MKSAVLRLSERLCTIWKVAAGTDVAQANADRVLLQAQDDVLVEEDARVHAVPPLREGRALNR
jgi:hypothetical protein